MARVTEKTRELLGEGGDAALVFQMTLVAFQMVCLRLGEGRLPV